MARMVIDGYGQVELNNVAFRRDGRIEAQCALSTVDFATVPAENGMILRVDKAAHTICFPSTDDANALYALNYSSEHIYDERNPGLKNFKLKPGDFYPRMGYLAPGDLWTTNCIDLGEYNSVAAVGTALASGSAVFAAVGTQGAVALTTAAPTAGPILQVIKKTTMPDGTDAFQLQVLAV